MLICEETNENVGLVYSALRRLDKPARIPTIIDELPDLDFDEFYDALIRCERIGLVKRIMFGYWKAIDLSYRKP